MAQQEAFIIRQINLNSFERESLKQGRLLSLAFSLFSLNKTAKEEKRPFVAAFLLFSPAYFRLHICFLL